MGRRSSAYGKGGKIEDPRPLGDKAFQTQNIKTLITYLTSHMYDKPISKQLLSAPTSKDFKHIITFLFKQLDSNFEFGEKYEDEVKMYMKEFGYPVAISKQSLYAVGSPHTWPPLLAALVWLIEFLQYSEEVESKEEKNILDNSDKLLFEYTAMAYSKFLNGEDNYAVLDEDLSKMFDVKNKSVKDDINRLRHHNEALKTEIMTLKNTQNDLSEFHSRRANYLSDLQKFTKLIEQVQAHKATLIRKLEEKKQELKERKEAMENMKLEKASLDKALSEQQITPFEVQRMNHQRQMCDEALQLLSKQKETVQNDIWQAEMQVSKKLSDVEHNVREFNAAAMALQMIPANAKYANGINFELRLNSNARTYDQLLNVDLKKVVKTELNLLKQKLSDKIVMAQKELRESREKVATTTEQSNELKDRVANCESRRKKYQDSFTQEREKLHADLTKIVSGIEDLELEVRKLKGERNSAVMQSEKKLISLEQEFVELEKAYAKERQEIHQDICITMDEVAAHKGKITDVLEAMENRTRQIRESL
jgi:kinetochore protein NDC80